MASSATEKQNSLDLAINVCDKNVSKHRVQSSWLLASVFATVVFFLGLYFWQHQSVRTVSNLLSSRPYVNDSTLVKNLDRVSENLEKSNSTTENVFYYGAFILVFSVLTSFYRFHLKEISKYEQLSLGYHRIRIAARNSKDKFETEVRTALTENAFSYEPKTSIFSKEKKVESPIPGHPSSDAFTYLLNKVLEKIPDPPKDAPKGTA